MCSWAVWSWISENEPRLKPPRDWGLGLELEGLGLQGRGLDAFGEGFGFVRLGSWVAPRAPFFLLLGVNKGEPKIQRAKGYNLGAVKGLRSAHCCNQWHRQLRPLFLSLGVGASVALNS